MTNAQSTARPYATAAFEAAKSANQLSMWSLALKQLSLAVQDKKMKSVLKNPKVTQSQLVELLNFFNDFKSIENFLKLLAEKKRINLLPAISELFENDVAKESGYISLIVTSAFAMSDEQKNNTKEKLSKQLNSKLEIDFKVDEKLMGGLLVRSGNWVMDGTVKGNLSRLRSVLV